MQALWFLFYKKQYSSFSFAEYPYQFTEDLVDFRKQMLSLGNGFFFFSLTLTSGSIAVSNSGETSGCAKVFRANILNCPVQGIARNLSQEYFSELLLTSRNLSSLQPPLNVMIKKKKTTIFFSKIFPKSKYYFLCFIWRFSINKVTWSLVDWFWAPFTISFLLISIFLRAVMITSCISVESNGTEKIVIINL